MAQNQFLQRHAERVGEHAAAQAADRARRDLEQPDAARGIFEGVSGLEAALAVKGVTGIRITAERGQIVAPPPEGTGYLGFIFARGRGPAIVVASLRNALKWLDFKLRPEVLLHASRNR